MREHIHRTQTAIGSTGGSSDLSMSTTRKKCVPMAPSCSQRPLWRNTLSGIAGRCAPRVNRSLGGVPWTLPLGTSAVSSWSGRATDQWIHLDAETSYGEIVFFRHNSIQALSLRIERRTERPVRSQGAVDVGRHLQDTASS